MREGVCDVDSCGKPYAGKACYVQWLWNMEILKAMKPESFEVSVQAGLKYIESYKRSRNICYYLFMIRSIPRNN